MKKYSLILIIFLSLLTFKGERAQAASISFATPPSINTGENLDVVINADTDGILVNSMELVISYDEQLLSFAGYSDDNSVIKLWIDPPHTDPNNQGKIYLSGIVPGGVLGLYDASPKNKQIGLAPIPLVHLLFLAKNAGDAKFSFSVSKILENDGLGTPLVLTELSADALIKNNPNNKNVTGAVQENPKDEKGLSNNNEIGNSSSQNSSNVIFWIVISILITSILIYRLLKYKHEE